MVSTRSSRLAASTVVSTWRPSASSRATWCCRASESRATWAARDTGTWPCSAAATIAGIGVPAHLRGAGDATRRDIEQPRDARPIKMQICILIAAPRAAVPHGFELRRDHAALGFVQMPALEVEIEDESEETEIQSLVGSADQRQAKLGAGPGSMPAVDDPAVAVQRDGLALAAGADRLAQLGVFGLRHCRQQVGQRVRRRRRRRFVGQGAAPLSHRLDRRPSRSGTFLPSPIALGVVPLSPTHPKRSRMADFRHCSRVPPLPIPPS